MRTRRNAVRLHCRTLVLIGVVAAAQGLVLAGQPVAAPLPIVTSVVVEQHDSKTDGAIHKAPFSLDASVAPSVKKTSLLDKPEGQRWERVWPYATFDPLGVTADGRIMGAAADYPLPGAKKADVWFGYFYNGKTKRAKTVQEKPRDIFATWMRGNRAAWLETEDATSDDQNWRVVTWDISRPDPVILAYSIDYYGKGKRLTPSPGEKVVAATDKDVFWLATSDSVPYGKTPPTMLLSVPIGGGEVQARSKGAFSPIEKDGSIFYVADREFGAPLDGTSVQVREIKSGQDKVLLTIPTSTATTATSLCINKERIAVGFNSGKDEAAQASVKFYSRAGVYQGVINLGVNAPQMSVQCTDRLFAISDGNRSWVGANRYLFDSRNNDLRKHEPPAPATPETDFYTSFYYPSDKIMFWTGIQLHGEGGARTEIYSTQIK